MKDIRQRLLATFQVEHKEHVQRIRETLAIVDQAGVVQSTDLDEAFRRAHSLKGAARAVDLRPIEHLAHRMETLFSRIRESKVSLDKAVARVISKALDASEDLLATMSGGQEAAEPVEALAAIDAILGSPEEPKPDLPVRRSSPDQVSEGGKAGPTSETTRPTSEAGPVARTSDADLLRVNARSLDRIVNSAGQLLTETIRQNQVTRELRQLGQQLADASTERERARYSGARVFQKLDSSPELAAAARYVNYLDHQFQTLSKQISRAIQLQSRNAWTLRSLAGELQRDVRQARMVPAENVFDGFRKMVRDLAKDAGKSIDMHVKGMQVEADRMVLQALKDPVMHMLRNAIDHGIEPEADRKAKHKPAEGRIDLTVEALGSQIVISVEDDGRGVDVARVSEIAVRKGLINQADLATRSQADLMRLVLLPGFSTSRAVTDLSGRGMGLSVVAQAAARLQGKVDIAPGRKHGTRVTLSAPISVSSHRLLLVSCQNRTLAIPLHGIERLLRVKVAHLETIESRPMLKVDGQPVPIVSLAHLLSSGESGVTANQNAISVMIMRSQTKRLAVAVDSFLSERDAIVKDLPAPADRNPQIAGGTLLEDGSVCLVLNPAEIVNAFKQSAELVLASEAEAAATKPAARSQEILIVDDSLTTRTLEKSVLEAHGYQVAIAVDGMDALNYLRSTPVGLVISDLEMPRLDGFGLLEEIRRDPRLAKTPVVIVSSVENPEAQARGLTLGADAYIVKRKFDQQELLDTIRQIL